jgi:hypothetical protein
MKILSTPVFFARAQGRSLQKALPSMLDTEGRVGEALGRPPLRQSREGVPNLYQALSLGTDEETCHLSDHRRILKVPELAPLCR